MIKTLQRLVVGAVIVGLAAGCSVLTPTSTPPSVAPFVVPSPSGQPLSVDQAAVRYVEIVDRRNEAINQYQADLDADRPWTTLRDDLAVQLAASETEAIQLAQTPWPADVQPLVDELVRSLVGRRQTMSDAAHATSEKQFSQRVRAIEADTSCPVADHVRELLGLERLDCGDSDS